jgi:hypothetical protein
VNFAFLGRRGGANRLNGFVRAAEHFSRFIEEEASAIGQAQGGSAAFEKRGSKFLFKVANLAAERRLRHVQTLGSPGDVLLLGHGNKVAEMAKFHARAQHTFQVS